MVFAMCCLNPGTTIVWTCHSMDAMRDTMAIFDEISLDLSLFIEKLSRAHGEERLIFINGSRIYFGARERGFGRGMSPDVLVLDQADVMSERTERDMVILGAYGLTIRL